MQPDILADTARRLRLAKESKTWAQIAAESGMGLDWLRKIAYGRIPNPGIRSIERLRAYLSAAGPRTERSSAPHPPRVEAPS